MGQIKYFYNTKTCNYEKIKKSKWDVLLVFFGFLGSSFIIAFIIFFLYSAYFESPKEAKLRQENETLKFYYALIQKELAQGNKVLAYLQNRDDHIYRTIFEVAPIPSAVRSAGIGGVDRYQHLLDKEKLIANTLAKVDQLKRQLYIQTKSYDTIGRLAKDKEKRLAAIPAIQPIANKQLKRLSSKFGIRLHPIHKIPIMHNGVDFAAKRGTPIYATGDGIVRLVKKDHGGYGNQIEIAHGYGFITKYAHMQSFKARYGQRVKRGQCIGYVGSSGAATAPHIHYEVIKNGQKVNPIHYFFNDLTPAQYEQLLELASRKIQSLCLN